MCSVSMISDHYKDKWDNQGLFVNYIPVKPVAREEFDALKAEVEDLKALLKRAKKYDADNGEPDCEIADKMDILRKVAKLVGVELDI